jgi:hypothetical protein
MLETLYGCGLRVSELVKKYQICFDEGFTGKGINSDLFQFSSKNTFSFTRITFELNEERIWRHLIFEEARRAISRAMILPL